MKTALDSARYYASKRLSVIPIKAQTKAPYHRDGANAPTWSRDAVCQDRKRFSSVLSRQGRRKVFQGSTIEEVKKTEKETK